MAINSCMKYFVPFALFIAHLTLAKPIPATDEASTPAKGPEAVIAEIKFGYGGSDGPGLWPGSCRDLKPGQSPINIRAGSADLNPTALPVTLSPQDNATVSNIGHGLAVTLSPNAAPSSFVPVGQPGGAQTPYQLVGFHLHTPSEHHIKGKYFDAEMHLVHKSAAGDVAVIGIMYEIGSESDGAGVMEAIESVMPKLQGSTPTPLPPFSFDNLIKNTNNFTEFHTYTGSLTTPPCSPNVLWHVMNKPHPMTVPQALALRNTQGFTARYVQLAKDEVPLFAATTGSLPKILSAVENAAAQVKTALGRITAPAPAPAQ